ncbi:CinA family protein [Mariniluteicoccus flavus]
MAIAQEVVRAYASAGLTVATAESLTGGLLGATITAVPGASAVYRGGLIVYATDAKATVGGLDAVGLGEHGAVSAWTVEGLARSVAERFGSDVGVALSGVAGPDAQEGWPAGTVWLGWAYAGTSGSTLLRLDGDRAAIRTAAVEAALGRLLAAAPA